MTDNLPEGAELDTAETKVDAQVSDAKELPSDSTAAADAPPPKADAPKAYTEQDYKKLENELNRERRRISKLTAQKYQYKAQLDQYVQQKPEQTQAGQNVDVPKADKFDNYEDYLRAMVQHEAKSIENSFTKRQQQSRVQEETQSMVEDFDAKAEELATQIPDFKSIADQVNDYASDLAPHVKRAFLEADNGALALYQAIKDGSIESLNGLSPYKVAATLARLEDKAKAAIGSAKKATNAPAPMASPRGTGNAGGKTLDNMGGKELLSWLRA